MIDLRRIIMTVALGLASVSLKAQQQAEMADTMRANGKIYVVVAVCLTILAGLIIYLITLDRKISRIEKDRS